MHNKKKIFKKAAAILILMCLVTGLLPSKTRAEELFSENAYLQEDTDMSADITEDSLFESVNEPEYMIEADGEPKADPTDFCESTFENCWTYTVGTEAKGNLYPDEIWNYEQFNTSKSIYKHHYKFTVEETGRYDIEFDRGNTGSGKENIYIVSDRDCEPNNNYYNDYVRWTSGDVGRGDYPVESYLDLEKGTTYHIMVENSDYSETVIPYSFKITKREAVKHRKDEADTADSLIEFGKTYNKVFVDYFRCDRYKNRFGEWEEYRIYPDPVIHNFDYQYIFQYYKVVVPTAGKLTVDVDSTNEIMARMAPNTDALPISNGINHDWLWDLGSMQGHTSKSVELIAGTYYLGFGLVDRITPYTFTVSFDPIVVGTNEKSVFDTKLNGSNTDWEYKDKIETGKTYVAQSAYGDENNSDWFCFELKKQSSVYFSISSSKIKEFSAGLYVSTIYNEPRYTYPQWTTGTDNYKPIAGEEIEIPVEDVHGKYTTLLPAGLYFLEIKKSGTGDYRFGISTGLPKPVDSVKITDKDSGKSLKSITLQIGKTYELSAQVLPADAHDVSVVWESSDDSIATVNSAGVVTGTAKGSCEIIVTSSGLNAKSQHVTDKITVTVLDKGETRDDPDDPDDPDDKVCPVVITKQKVDLSAKEYFGTMFDKTDKWKVEPSASGSVSKGIFTAKKPGEVTVTRMDKKKNVLGMVKFTVETPDIDYPVNPKNGKKLSTITYYRIDEVIDVTKLISTKAGLTPVKYECSDKKGKNFEFNAKDNTLKVLKSGSCKITVYYNYGLNEKYAAKYPINIKSVLPSLKAKVNLKANKSTKVSISKVQKGTNVSWIAVGYDEESDEYVVSDLIKVEEVPGSDGLKCKITAGDKKGKAYLFALVGEEKDGYLCEVTIK